MSIFKQFITSNDNDVDVDDDIMKKKATQKHGKIKTARTSPVAFLIE